MFSLYSFSAKVRQILKSCNDTAYRDSGQEKTGFPFFFPQQTRGFLKMNVAVHPSERFGSFYNIMNYLVIYRL